MIGVWALGDQTSLEAITLYLIGMLFTILNDCITLGTYSKTGVAFGDGALDSAKFSFAMALISLIFKPIIVIFVLQEYNRRGGSVSIPGVSISSSAHYEPIGGSSPDPAQDPSSTNNNNNNIPPNYSNPNNFNNPNNSASTQTKYDSV